MKTFKLHFLPLLLVAVGATCTWNVQAQDFKAGYVSIQRITTESTPAKTAQNKLEQEFSKRQKEINDLQGTLKTFSDKFERDNTTMSESQRNARQREGAEMTRDLQRRQREFQEDLNSRRNEELQQVLDRANKAVKQVADAEKYDVVLQEVVYVNPKHDITDKVLKLLNK